MSELVVLVTRPGAAERFVVTASGELSVGRRPESTIYLPNPLVSRDHLRIALLPGGQVRVSDLGSRNGSLANGVRLSGAAEDLAPPVHITVGPYELQVQPPGIASGTTVAEEAALVGRALLDRELRRLFVDGRVVVATLSPHEFAFLDMVSRSAPAIADRLVVADAVWGEGQWDAYMLHNLVRRLRRKIGEQVADPEAVIVTVAGVGFRLA